MGVKASPRTLAFTSQKISPGYLQLPWVMRHFGFLNFDARNLILTFEWSMGRSAKKVPQMGLRVDVGSISLTPWFRL